MKVLALASFIFCLSGVAYATDTVTADNDKNAPKSSADYFDGTAMDAQTADPGKPMRAPTSGDLPYSDDEIQQNAPENYKTKNMPIDQD